MAFDYKKEYREFYLPPRKPGIICVPEMRFAAVRGHGDPNEEGGDYQHALSMLYAVSYTLKMSKMGTHRIEGYFDYVVPPLEGLWWQEGAATIDLSRKKELIWVAMIRLPEFAGEEALDWARTEAERKKSIDCARVEFFPIRGGRLCAVHARRPLRYRAGNARGHARVRRRAWLGARRRRGAPPPRDIFERPAPRRAEKCKTVLRQPLRRDEA